MVIFKLLPSWNVKFDFMLEICRGLKNFTAFVELFPPTTLILENSSFDLWTSFGVIGKEASCLVQIAMLVISKVNHSWSYTNGCCSSSVVSPGELYFLGGNDEVVIYSSQASQGTDHRSKLYSLIHECHFLSLSFFLCHFFFFIRNSYWSLSSLLTFVSVFEMTVNNTELNSLCKYHTQVRIKNPLPSTFFFLIET